MVVARRAIALLVVSLSTPAFAGGPPITAAEARAHVGKRVTVCGKVVATREVVAPDRGGKQTFLYFDEAPPGAKFEAIVIGNDLAGGGVFFGIGKKVDQKSVCVTGYVKPRGDAGAMMLLDAPNQIKIVADTGQ